MRFPDNTVLEKTDLEEECCSWIQAWISGRISSRSISMLVQERFLSSPRTRGATESVNCENNAVDLISFNLVSDGPDLMNIYNEFFKDGPEVLFLKAKSVLVGAGVFSGISNISIPQVNSTFRRLCLETRWADTVVDSPPRSFNLRHLHVYMEIIRAYMQLHKSPGRSPFNTPTPSSARVIKNEYNISPTDPDFSNDDPAVVQSINSTVDDYLIRLMKLKTRSLKILSVHKRDSLYAFLGVSPDVSDSVLKRAYRQKAMELHPDKGGSKEMFQQLNEVYETILEERGVAGSGGSTTPEEHQEVPQPRPTTPAQSKISADSAVKVLKAATKCVTGAKKATETAAKIIENPNRHTIDEFVKHVRDVGYACLDVSCVLDEGARSAVSSEAFNLLNAANLIADSVAVSSDLIEVIGDTTKKCVSCAQLVSKIAQVHESEKSPMKPIVHMSRQTERLEVAKRQRIENAQLLRKLDHELSEQHHMLIAMIKPDDIDHSLIEWYKLAMIDHVNDCLVEVKDLARQSNSPIDCIDEFVKRCQLFDQLCVPVTSIGRACRLVYITNPSFVKKRVFDQIVSGTQKIQSGETLQTSYAERLHGLLVSALGKIEHLNISTSSSRQKSTKSSPLVRPIEIDTSERIHSSDTMRI